MYICVTYELLMHAVFVADEIWGSFILEPAREHLRGPGGYLHRS